MNLGFLKRQGKSCKIFVRKITINPSNRVLEMLKAHNIVIRQRISKSFPIRDDMRRSHKKKATQGKLDALVTRMDLLR